jgi:hypothetical protein
VFAIGMPRALICVCSLFFVCVSPPRRPQERRAGVIARLSRSFSRALEPAGGKPRPTPAARTAAWLRPAVVDVKLRHAHQRSVTPCGACSRDAVNRRARRTAGPVGPSGADPPRHRLLRPRRAHDCEHQVRRRRAEVHHATATVCEKDELATATSRHTAQRPARREPERARLAACAQLRRPRAPSLLRF